MNPRDYAIDHAGYDWGLLLSSWRDLLPKQFDLFLVNKFGDAVVIFEDGSLHLLDVGAGVMPRLAGDLDEFIKLLPDYGGNWLLTPLVDACVAAGLVPGAGECYSYKQPPLLGGTYDVANVHVVTIPAHYSFLAEIHRQVRELPDGTRVTPKRYVQF